MGLRPLRNLIQVERMPDLGRTRDGEGNEVTAGGIVIPQDYKARGSHKAVRKADFFRARVLAIGPQVRDLEPGNEVLVITWAAESDGTRRGLYTGADGPDGTLFVEYPDDLVCAVDAAEMPFAQRMRLGQILELPAPDTTVDQVLAHAANVLGPLPAVIPGAE